MVINFQSIKCVKVKCRANECSRGGEELDDEMWVVSVTSFRRIQKVDCHQNEAKKIAGFVQHEKGAP